MSGLYSSDARYIFRFSMILIVTITRRHNITPRSDEPMDERTACLLELFPLSFVMYSVRLIMRGQRGSLTCFLIVQCEPSQMLNNLVLPTRHDIMMFIVILYIVINKGTNVVGTNVVKDLDVYLVTLFAYNVFFAIHDDNFSFIQIRYKRRTAKIV